MTRQRAEPMHFDPGAQHTGPMSPHVSVQNTPDGVRLSVRGVSVVLPVSMALEFANLIITKAGEHNA